MLAAVQLYDEPCGCFVLDAVRGHELGFDDNGRAVGCGDEDVGLQGFVAGDGLRAFGADVAAVHHAAQDVGEGGVGGRFGVSWHVVRFLIVSGVGLGHCIRGGGVVCVGGLGIEIFPSP